MNLDHKGRGHGFRDCCRNEVTSLGGAMFVKRMEIGLGAAPGTKSLPYNDFSCGHGGHGSRGCCMNEVTSPGGAIAVRLIEISLGAAQRTK